MKEKELYHTVLQKMLISGEHAKPEIDATTSAKPIEEKKRFRISRRAIIAIAVAASLLVVGSAAAATSIFTRRNYTPEHYLNQDAEQREANGESIPDVEDALKNARPKDVSYTIRMMPEIDDRGIIANWREFMGQPPYNEADWAWVRTLKPTIGDVLYDGKSLYVTTYVETDRPELFYCNTDTEQQLWIACEEATYTVEGDDRVHTIEIYGENWGSGYTDHSVTITAQSYPTEHSELFPDEGVITMTERLYVADALCDDMQPTRAAIAIIDFTFTFDAAAGRPVAEETHMDIPLSGDHIFTVYEWRQDGNTPSHLIMENKRISFDGVVLDAKIEYRPIGIYVTIGIKDAPDTWTENEKKSLLSAINENEQGAPAAVCRINGGETVSLESMNYEASDSVYLLLPVYPSDYATVSELTLDLNLYRITAGNGSVPSDDWSFEFGENTSLHVDSVESELIASVQIPIPVTK